MAERDSLHTRLQVSLDTIDTLQRDLEEARQAAEEAAAHHTGREVQEGVALGASDTSGDPAPEALTGSSSFVMVEAVEAESLRLQLLAREEELMQVRAQGRVMMETYSRLHFTTESASAFDYLDRAMSDVSVLVPLIEDLPEHGIRSLGPMLCICR